MPPGLGSMTSLVPGTYGRPIHGHEGGRGKLPGPDHVAWADCCPVQQQGSASLSGQVTQGGLSYGTDRDWLSKANHSPVGRPDPPPTPAGSPTCAGVAHRPDQPGAVQGFQCAGHGPVSVGQA